MFCPFSSPTYGVYYLPLKTSNLDLGIDIKLQCNHIKSCEHLCRPFQEVTLEPLAHLNLPLLEHLELRAQNVTGFGTQQLEPLAKAHMPCLKYSLSRSTSMVLSHLYLPCMQTRGLFEAMKWSPAMCVLCWRLAMAQQVKIFTVVDLHLSRLAFCFCM